MKKLKKGFTLAEMLVCLGIIAVVVAIMIPAALSKRPTKNKALFRKSYYNFERVISELINDETLFPETKPEEHENDPSTLFAYFIADPEELAKEENEFVLPGAPGRVQRTQARTKQFLCTQIAQRMNTNGPIDCVISSFPRNSGVVGNFRPNFTTNEGVEWYTLVNGYMCANIPQDDGSFVARPEGTDCGHDENLTWNVAAIAARRDYTCYDLDVNGSERPNCRDCAHPDQFRICVYYDGKVAVPHDGHGKEAEYLRDTRIIDDN